MTRFGIRGRHGIYAVAALVCVFVVAALMRETHRDPVGQIWHEATFFGSVLVTLGWIFTSEVAIGNSRRQHTISLFTGHVFDRQRISDRDTIKEYLPTYKSKLTAEIVDFDNEQSPLLKAIDLELNFYEFMAVGCWRGDLDEGMLKQSLRSQFCSFFVQTEDYIRHWQRKNPSTWCELSRMYERWQGNDRLAAAFTRLYGRG